MLTRSQITRCFEIQMLIIGLSYFFLNMIPLLVDLFRVTEKLWRSRKPSQRQKKLLMIIDLATGITIGT